MRPDLITVKEKWRGLRAKQRKAEGLMVDLMKHPDTTLDQLGEARAACLKSEVVLREVVPRLRELFPPMGDYFIAHEWNTAPFDKYVSSTTGESK